MQILHRITGAVLWSSDANSIRDAVVAAVDKGASLEDANLEGVDLTGVNLGGANLTDANLTYADLVNANLKGADLTGAYLRKADLRGANLTDANLTGAYLADADMRVANLRGANLADADLTGADMRCANLAGENIPVIENIDAKILEAVSSKGCSLDMEHWHSCKTTHCRAGWAIILAGDAGKALEERVGPSAAGALIYAASRPGTPVPNFYASDEDAMADLRKCAGVNPF